MCEIDQEAWKSYQEINDKKKRVPVTYEDLQRVKQPFYKYTARKINSINILNWLYNLLAVTLNIWKIFRYGNNQCKQCHKGCDENHRCTAGTN